VGSRGWMACHNISGTRSPVVMAADHAHEQGEQQEPAKGRKHALKRSMELPKLMLAALGPGTIGNHWYLADSSGHDRAGISPADGAHSGMDCRSLRPPRLAELL
jgi:hypothetical protein